MAHGLQPSGHVGALHLAIQGGAASAASWLVY